MDRLLRDYYRAMGWNEDGVPPETTDRPRGVVTESISEKYGST